MALLERSPSLHLRQLKGIIDYTQSSARVSFTTKTREKTLCAASQQQHMFPERLQGTEQEDCWKLQYRPTFQEVVISFTSGQRIYQTGTNQKLQYA